METFLNLNPDTRKYDELKCNCYNDIKPPENQPATEPPETPGTPRIWIATPHTSNNIYKFNPATNELLNFSYPLLGSNIYYFKGSIWAMIGNNLNKINPQTGEATETPVELGGSPALLSSAGEYLIFRGNNFNRKSYIARINPETYETAYLTVAIQSITQDEIRHPAIFDGINLWLPSGTQASKLRQINLNTMELVNTYSNLPVWKGVYNNGFLWLDTMNEAGIYKINPENGALMDTLNVPKTFDMINAFNNIWSIGYDIGLYKINPVNGAVTSKDYPLWTIKSDNNAIWATDDQKLYKINSETLLIEQQTPVSITAESITVSYEQAQEIRPE